MAATKVKIKIDSIFAIKDKSMVGPGDWQFDAKVTMVANNKTTTLGDPAKTFEAKPGERFDVGWSSDFPIAANDTVIKITVKGKDTSAAKPVDLGDVEVQLNIPITHGYSLSMLSSATRYNVRIELEILESVPGFSGPVTTILQNPDASTHNSIHNEMAARTVHICPIIPVPWSIGMPPVAKGVDLMDASDQQDWSIEASETKLNSLYNPALIPVLDPLDPDFANKCARIRITQVRPKDLDITKLIWRSKSSSLLFWDGSQKSEIKGGLEIQAYGHLTGDADEEVSLEVRWDAPGTPLLATFRAYVGKIKYIWARATVVKCAKDKIGEVPLKNPTATPAAIKGQLVYNNVLLWQVGLQIALDTDPTAYNGAIFKETGIFELTTAENHTFNIVDDDKIVAPLLNSRAGIFNLAYIHSTSDDPLLLGEATDRRLSPAASSNATMSGSPSVSWVRPTGVFPDDAGQEVKMKTFEATAARDPSQKNLCGDGAIDKLCACIMTERSINFVGDNTMAHELGHVLGLNHRGNGGRETFGSTDGVNHLAGPRKGRGQPWTENVLSYGPKTRAQDFDMLQAKVIRTHKLLKDAPPSATPPPPKPKKPLPAAWLPSKNDIILMQEYLGGTREGLQHTGYDLGATGPNGDGVDGVVGHFTKQAVMDFQRDHGALKIDGIYGPKTRAAFDQELNG